MVLLEKIGFGWLPKEPRAISGPSGKHPMSRTRRLASFFAFEFLVVFVSVSVFQLAGLGSYPGFVAGAVAPIGGALGSILFMRPKGVELRAEVAGLDIPTRQLDHVIDHWLVGLIVEGTASDADLKESQDRFAVLQKGDTVSYNMVTDEGKAVTGSASIKRVAMRAKSGGRLKFEVRMRRIRE